MKGMLDLETLTRLVEAGEIDTVLVASRTSRAGSWASA